MNSPIFVSSTGRCGTLALQRFLKRSNELEAFHRYRGRKSRYRNDMSFVLEQNYAYYYVLRSQEHNSKKRRFIIRNLRRSRSSLIQILRQEGKGFVELNHEFSPFGPLLAEAFPDAKFIHLVRNPKSVISSFMQKFAPPPMALPAFMGTRYSILGQYVLRYGRVTSLSRLTPPFVRNFVESHRFDTHLHPFEKVDGEWQEVQRMNSFEKTCWYWNEVNKLTIEFFDQLAEEKKRRVYFEAIFTAESQDAKRSFLDFVGVSDLAVADMMDFFKSKVNVKEIHNPFPSPENWDESILEVMYHYCQETMEQLGYA